MLADLFASSFYSNNHSWLRSSRSLAGLKMVGAENASGLRFVDGVVLVRHCRRLLLLFLVSNFFAQVFSATMQAASISAAAAAARRGALVGRLLFGHTSTTMTSRHAVLFEFLLLLYASPTDTTPLVCCGDLLKFIS